MHLDLKSSEQNASISDGNKNKYHSVTLKNQRLDKKQSNGSIYP